VCRTPGLVRADADPGDLAILADTDGAPRVHGVGGAPPYDISISHRSDWALCVVATGARVHVGCDMEIVEPRSDAFVADYFTDAERALVEAATQPERALLANLIWSAKESAVKARRSGWRVDTRSVDVALPTSTAQAGWTPLSVFCASLRSSLPGWWRRDGDRISTVVTTEPARVPQRLVNRAGGAPARCARAPGALRSRDAVLPAG
jgi:4'-phosphopantetheinyl transferase